MKSCRTCQASYPSDFTVCPQDATPLVEVGTWAEGAVVRGKYRILCKIGQGGFGAVYKAQHVRFDELRALKVITPERANDPSFVKRFFHEAVITRKLQHPNAVRVEDVDEAEDGSPFIVMEYLEGRSLKSLMRDEGRLPVPRVCSIAKQAAMALGAAHNLNMVHRDIKPDNIFIVNGPEGEQVKVLDFGIAKVKEASLGSAGDLTQTKSGMIVGTVQYMSPEQAMGMRGDELDGRSDLYSLGVVMYEMLSGDPPFRAGTTMKILLAHLHEPPPPIRTQHPEIQISESIERLVMRLLQKERDARPATADDLIEEIECAVAAPGPPLVSTMVAMPTEIVSGWRGENRPATIEPGNPSEIPQATRPTVVPQVLASPPLPAAAPVAPPAATTQQPHVAARAGANLSSRPSARIEASKSRRSLGVWTKVGVLFTLVALTLLIVSVPRHPRTPNETPAEASARHLRSGDSTRWGDKSFDAVNEYREATRLTPDSSVAHFELGVTLDSKHDTDGAIAEYREAIRLQPNDPDTHHALGMDLLSRRDWDGAIRELRTSLQITPKEELHESKGRPVISEIHLLRKARLMETDFGGAIPALRNNIQVSPHDAILHDLLGIALESSGQLQSALAEYRRAFELDPKNGDYQSDYKDLQERIPH